MQCRQYSKSQEFPECRLHKLEGMPAVFTQGQASGLLRPLAVAVMLVLTAAGCEAHGSPVRGANSQTTAQVAPSQGCGSAAPSAAHQPRGGGTPEQPGTGDNSGPEDVHGNPEAATRYWAKQSQSDCGLMATRMIVGEVTGYPPTEQQIIDLATKTPSECSPGEPIYDSSYDPSDGGMGHGTCTTDLVLLLKHYGIRAIYTNDDIAAHGGIRTGLDALESYLDQNQQAIVCVNSHTIWNDDGDRAECGHTVTVAAIDTCQDIVYLGDSGDDDTRGETVAITVFEDAWKTGSHELIVTATN